MTFEEANYFYEHSESMFDAKHDEAVSAFGLEMYRGICLKCSRHRNCFMSLDHVREVAKCNFFEEETK